MPVDTSMYAQQTPPENPLAMASQVVGLQGQMQQNQLLQRTMQARQAIGQAVQGATDANGNYDPLAAQAAASQDRNAAFGAQEFQGFNQGQQAQQQALHMANLQQAITVRGALNQALGSVLSDPNNINTKFVTGVIGDLVGSKILPATEGASQIRQMPSDPSALKSWLTNHLAQGLQMSEQLHAMMPPAQAIDTGSKIEFVRNPALGATPGPLDKTLSPESAAQRVAGPVNPDGSPTQISLGQANGMGPITTGQGPAAAAAATTSGAGTAQDSVAFENNARQLPALSAALRNMSGDIKQLNTGPGSARRGSFIAAVQSVMGSGFDAERVARQEGLDKLGVQVRARMQQTLGLPTTDQTTALIGHATPGSDLSKLGNTNMIGLIKGDVDYATAQNKAWETYKANGHGAETFHQFSTAFNQRVDPIVFQMQYMSKGQRADLTGAMSAAEKDQLAKNIAFARHNKLIP